jgi:hypothetical protein
METQIEITIVICITRPRNCTFASMSTVYNTSRQTSIVSTNARKTVSGRVIHKIFRADFCGFLLNGS